MFGIEKEEWAELGGIYTATEIRQQPRLWNETYEIIKNNKNEINDFLVNNIKSNTRVILTGAGTSDYVGDSIYLYLSKKLGIRVEAIATTDLVSNPYEIIEEDTPTILVSFARSGNSPESVGAYDILNENIKDIAQIVITCNKNGELAKKSIGGKTLSLIMPEESNDKSFAMTSSLSSMMLAALLVFDIDNLEENKKIVDIIVSNADKILENNWTDIKDIVGYGCTRVVYLGSGALKGLAQEMALKNLELTSGKTITICESVLGFRHGPKSIIDDETLVIMMNSVNDYTNRYDMDLIREISGDAGSHKLCVVSYRKNEEIGSLTDKYIEIDGREIPEVYTIFNYMLLGQMFGLFSALKTGISPDNPRPDGTVNRVVQGVTIHKFN